MNQECELKDGSQSPIDDRTTDLAGAVESLSDDELRDLLVALLSEWRKRCDVGEAFPN
ncbi:hypothetical protein [Parvibaculum sp.]|uniref:hypothetical protein n=1 Tax=Parvibaculum sp. TaxID=2024848 RepID=UPI00271E1344|nr:hypothetical protein [Parvibaculum sp.]MDO9125823.1 hypothetical protein [Parvibaculum sp.]MDP1626184.1 hypothetical protein [Parvibaculum sp.]MDP2151501.1 hypothetical protein [Parvibaculum sp.]MDP3329169.1 hypothetical protein [Parvibaculum sp.]